MRVVHVLRKPCSESTVAANVLRHGTGCVNVDASRIPYQDGGTAASNPMLRKRRGLRMSHGADTTPSSYAIKQESGTMNVNDRGRWPANLVLQHLPGCRGSCEPGCPVAALDAQSGTLAPQGGQKKKDTKAASFLGTGHGGAPDSTFYGDTGGASRFFKQFGGGEP